MHNNQKIGVVIPTYNGGKTIEHCLLSLKKTNIPIKVLVIDSSSNDDTYDIAKYHADELLIINQHDFDHGAVRQLGVDKLCDFDILIFMTQDVIIENSETIGRLIGEFDDEHVGAVCGRQLPHYNATSIAAHARQFNYPDSYRKCYKEHIETLGIKAAFMSDSFAAYRKGALDDVGGFPTKIIMGEDMIVAAKMLLAGWSVVYCGDARVYHSHNYSLFEEFKRYFDIGVMHERESEIIERFGAVQGEGYRFVRSELIYLKDKNIRELISALVRSASKYIAYTIGRNEARIPSSYKKLISMNKGYWKY